jgi:hypothetical protein
MVVSFLEDDVVNDTYSFAAQVLTLASRGYIRIPRDFTITQDTVEIQVLKTMKDWNTEIPDGYTGTISNEDGSLRFDLQSPCKQHTIDVCWLLNATVSISDGF